MVWTFLYPLRNRIKRYICLSSKVFWYELWVGNWWKWIPVMSSWCHVSRCSWALHPWLCTWIPSRPLWTFMNVPVRHLSIEVYVWMEETTTTVTAQVVDLQEHTVRPWCLFVGQSLATKIQHVKTLLTAIFVIAGLDKWMQKQPLQFRVGRCAEQSSEYQWDTL